MYISLYIYIHISVTAHIYVQNISICDAFKWICVPYASLCIRVYPMHSVTSPYAPICITCLRYTSVCQSLKHRLQDKGRHPQGSQVNMLSIIASMVNSR